jgi:trimethylamine corrinoid protein
MQAALDLIRPHLPAVDSASSGIVVIGMSALLTTTMEEQRKVIKTVKEQGLPFKTVVGGAPCTQRWADQIGADAYAEDANDGVKKMDALLAAG